VNIFEDLILYRRDTAAELADVVLQDGEPMYEKDTKLQKIGDGASPGSELDAAAFVDGITHQFGDLVREAIASNLGSPSTPEGAALAQAFIKRTTRSFMLPVADSNSAAGASARDFTQRTAVRFPKGTKRFWIRWANHNVLTGTVLTSPMTITSLYMGLPVFETTGLRRWTQNYASTPTQIVSTPIVVPTDGSDVEVGPFTLPPELVGKEILLSYGITTTSAGTGVGISLSGDGYRLGTSAQAGATTLAGTAEVGKIFGDLRFRVEVDSSSRIGVFLGDSLTAGFALGAAPAEGTTRVGSVPHERWPDAAGRQANFHAVNGGVASAPAGLFASTSAMAITRLGIGTVCDVPDFGVVWLGANNLVGAGVSSDALQNDLANAVSTLRALGIHDIYACTLTPQGFASKQGALTADAAVGATTVLSSINPLYSGQNLVIGTALDYEPVTVASQSGTSSPWTLTLAAPLAKAHPSGSRVAVDAENIRLRVNNWLRQKPMGIAAVLEFDHFVTNNLDDATAIQQFMCNDNLHFNRGGYGHLAARAAGSLSRIVTV
jgi:hypothetical protein